MKSFSTKSAFTLIELLVVISIILIASSIIFIGGTGGSGAKLSSSQRIVSGIAQGARGQAILKNAETRLIIYSEIQAANALDEEKLLRFIGIVYWEEDENNDGDETTDDQGWVAATQGTYLPEGIYFNRGLSGGDIPTMNLDYPRISVGANTDRIDGGGGEQYYFFEFNSNGTIASSSPDTKAKDFTNSRLALQAGTLKPGSGTSLEVVFTEEENENLKAGLIFRRSGTTTLINDPSDV